MHLVTSRQLRRLEQYDHAIAFWPRTFPKAHAFMLDAYKPNCSEGGLVSSVWGFCGDYLSEEDQLQFSMVNHASCGDRHHEGSWVSCRQKMGRMVVHYLTMGRALREKWGSVFLQPPLCFALMGDPYYGPSAARVFRDLSGRPAVSSIDSASPVCSKLTRIFEPNKQNITHWWEEMKLSECDDDVLRLASRRVQIERHGDARPAEVNLGYLGWDIYQCSYPKLARVLKSWLLCLRIHQMFSENTPVNQKHGNFP